MEIDITCKTIQFLKKKKTIKNKLQRLKYKWTNLIKALSLSLVFLGVKSSMKA